MALTRGKRKHNVDAFTCIKVTAKTMHNVHQASGLRFSSAAVWDSEIR